MDTRAAMFASIERLFQNLFVTSGGVTLLFIQSLLDIRLRPTDVHRLLRQMVVIGVQTLPLAMMIGFFTGMIIALNVGVPLQEFGQEDRIGNFLGLAMVREFGPVFTAFILAARVGAAMTAELGTMAVGEEVDSLRVLGIKPSRYLAMPRIVASLLMNPILTTYATATGLFGGMLLAQVYLGVASEQFWFRVFEYMDWEEIRTGLIKAIVFGGLYSSICVYYGLKTTGGAEGVGRSTTRAVVISLTMILVADFLLTRALIG
jgi:phospholipid/cholesterol/gamma-HCH transport system permease protein